MAILLSTCLANRMAGQEVTVTDAGSQISFTAPSTIATTQSDFLTKGFRPGQTIKITSGGATTQTTLHHTIASLVAGTITTSEALIVTEAAAVDTPTISVPNGMDWLHLLRYGVFCVYTSPMPANADLAPTGTLLLKMTVSDAGHTAGTSTGGIEWEFDAAGKIQIKTGDTVQGTGLISNTAYYGRIYDNAYITTLDSVNLASPRIQGRVGTSGQDFDITDTDVTLGVVNTLESFNITQPLSA